MTNFLEGFFPGLGLGAIVIFIMFGLYLIGDQSDAINTRLFGQRLCESKGLQYDYRTFLPQEEVTSNINTNVPVNTNVPLIHCKQNTTETIYDGVVVKEVRR